MSKATTMEIPDIGSIIKLYPKDKVTGIAPNKHLAFHIAIIMLITISRVQCGVLPVHTPLDKLLVGTVLTCLPDEV